MGTIRTFWKRFCSNLIRILMGSKLSHQVGLSEFLSASAGSLAFGLLTSQWKLQKCCCLCWLLMPSCDLFWNVSHCIFFLPSVQKTCLLRSFRFNLIYKLDKLKAALNKFYTLDMGIDLTFCEGMARLAVGAVGLAAPVFVFPGQGHTIQCVARSKDTLWIFMIDSFYIMIYQTRWYSMIFVYTCFSSAGSENNILWNYHPNSHCSCFKFRLKLSEGAAPRSSQCLSQTGCSWFLKPLPDGNDDANKDS